MRTLRTLHDLRESVDARRRRRERRRRLRRELAEYRTSAEQHELQALLARFDVTLDELVTDSPAPGGRDVDPGGARGGRGDVGDLWGELDLERPHGEGS